MSEINKTKAQRFKDTWHKLHAQHAQIDFEMAQLAAEIRAEFPKGPSGDLQFRAWCMNHIDVHSSRAKMLLSAGQAARVFSDGAVWCQIGGWRSVCFLMGLSAAHRTRVLTATHERIALLGHNVTHSVVWRVALELGVATPVKTGRPNQTKTEQKLNVLRLFLQDLYKSGKKLPPLPKDVQAAMELGIRGELLARAAQAS